MKDKTRKRLTTIIRLVLAVVFVSWAIHGVTWSDRVTLKHAVGDGPSEPPFRYPLVAEAGDSVTVLSVEGERVRVPLGDVAVDETGDPRIERGLSSAIEQSDVRIIALALLVFAPVPMLQSWRFKVLLRAQEIHLTYWECVKLSFGGNFLNFVFLMGTTAGDVFKAYYTALHTQHKTEAVTTILLDRFVGLAGLLIVAVAAMFIGSENAWLNELRLYAVLILAAMIVGAIVVTWAPLRRLVPLALLERLPGYSQIKRAHGATDRLLRHIPLVVSALLIAIVLQFIAIGAGVVCAYALHMDFSGSKVWDYFAFIGSGHVVASIPITPQGLGTMEVAYKEFFLGSYGSLSQLLCLALLLRVMQFAWSMPGALVTLMGAYKPRAHPSLDELGEPAPS